MKTASDTLHERIATSNDEFYTLYETVENELRHYRKFLEGKKVYCPCDTEGSEFVHYLTDNQKEFGILEVSWSFLGEESCVTTRFIDGTQTVESLEGNGDCTKGEVLSIMRRNDVIITNPPFNCFKEFMDNIFLSGCDYIILGMWMKLNQRLLLNEFIQGRLRLGYMRNGCTFEVPEESKGEKGVQFKNGRYYKGLGTAAFMTSFPIPYPKPQNLVSGEYKTNTWSNKVYSEALYYPKNSRIPDFEGYMFLPNNFVCLWNPEQFQLCGIEIPVVEGVKKFTCCLVKKV